MSRASAEKSRREMSNLPDNNDGSGAKPPPSSIPGQSSATVHSSTSQSSQGQKGAQSQQSGGAGGSKGGQGHTLVLRTVAGRRFPIQLQQGAWDDTGFMVSDLKDMAARAHELRRDGMVLLSGGTHMSDERPLSHYKGSLVGGVCMVLLRPAKKGGATGKSYPTQDQTAKPGQPTQPQQSAPGVQDLASPNANESVLERASREAEITESEWTASGSASGPLTREQVISLRTIEKAQASKGEQQLMGSLLHHSTVGQVRRLIRSNPALLRPLLLQLKHWTPSILGAIKGHQTAFLSILNYTLPPTSPRFTPTPTTPSEQSDESSGFPPAYGPEGPPPSSDPNMPEVAEGEEGEGGIMDEEATSNIPREDILPPPSSLEPESVKDVAAILSKLERALVDQGRIGEALAVAEEGRVVVSDSLGLPLPPLPPVGGGPPPSAGTGGAGGRVTISLADHRAGSGVRAIPKGSAPPSPPDGEESGHQNGVGVSLHQQQLREIASTGPGCTVLYYSLLPAETPTTSSHRLHIWVVPRNQRQRVVFACLWVDMDTLMGDLATLRRCLSRNSGINPRAAWRRILRTMHATLVQPIAHALPRDPTETLVVVPPLSGPLQQVPFPALVGSDGHFLVECHPISMADSFHTLAACNAYMGYATSGRKLRSLTEPESLTSLIKTVSRRVQHMPEEGQAGMPEPPTGKAHPDPETMLIVHSTSLTKGCLTATESIEAGRQLTGRGECLSLFVPSYPTSLSSPGADTFQSALDAQLAPTGGEPNDTQPKGVAHCYRRAVVQTLAQNPEIDPWVWGGWTLFGHPNAGALDGSAPVASEQPAPEQPGVVAGAPPAAATAAAAQATEGEEPPPIYGGPPCGPRGRCGAQRRRRPKGVAADMNYLQEKGIHILYEKLMQALLEEKPEQPAAFISEFLTRSQMACPDENRGGAE